FFELLDTAAGPDRLVIHLHVRVQLPVLAQPLLVERVRKSGACALQAYRTRAARSTVVVASDRGEQKNDCTKPRYKLKASLRDRHLASPVLLDCGRAFLRSSNLSSGCYI